MTLRTVESVTPRVDQSLNSNVSTDQNNKMMSQFMLSAMFLTFNNTTLPILMNADLVFNVRFWQLENEEPRRNGAIWDLGEGLPENSVWDQPYLKT